MAKIFDIPKQSFPSVADAYNSLIGIDNTERVVNLPLSQLDEIDEQPFPVNEDKVDQIADSIENVGVIEPVIVVKNGDRYSILSGRHRFRACQKLYASLNLVLTISHLTLCLPELSLFSEQTATAQVFSAVFSLTVLLMNMTISSSTAHRHLTCSFLMP